MKANFETVDYSAKYYCAILKNPLPQRWGGKFVQVSRGETEYIIFAPKEFAAYHADIVKHFCDERCIDGTYNHTEKRFDIVDPAWTITGGGKFEIDRAQRTIRLFDNSLAYGKYDRRGLREKLARGQGFIDYSVTME